MTQTIVTRFAPSPTGYITIGNFRTALLSYLFAGAHQGKFLLRFEDTDRQRSSVEYTKQLMSDMAMMGLTYDESLVLYQSERTAVYDKYFTQLKEQGLLYECYCSQEDLAIERKVQLASGQPPRYSGRCRHLSAEQKGQLQDAQTPSVLRFAIANDWSYTVDDLLMGPKLFKGSDIGDFVVRKADGDPTFFFCNAVDDALSGVTHVLRGDDHLTNTPRQAALLEKLGLPIPQYAHFPMILGSDHKPLSKRNGSSSIKQLVESGYRPEAIINYLSRLGYPNNSPELQSLQELSVGFDITKLSRSSAHYDQKHLQSWQKRAFQGLKAHERAQYLMPYAPILNGREEEFWQLCCSQFAMPHDIHHWIERLHANNWIQTGQDLGVFSWSQDAVDLLIEKWGHVAWADLTAELKKLGIQGASLFKPLRLLMTGQMDGPELNLLYAYMDREIILDRIAQKGL